MRVTEAVRGHEEKAGVVIKRTGARETLVLYAKGRKNKAMRPIAGLLVAAAVLFGVYELYLKRMPSSDPGTAPAQAISLTGVKNDLLQIAQAERGNIALKNECISMDELVSPGALYMARRERDGYSYQVDCSGTDFRITARHPAAPEGSPIRYPNFAIDSTMEVREVQ